MLSMVVVQNVEARGPDEPCSYLKPHEWTRDESGNCIRTSIVPVTANSPVTSRSVNEPCSYLNPTKYVRDSQTGLCHEVVVSAPVPQPANTAPQPANVVLQTANIAPQPANVAPQTANVVTTGSFTTPQYQNNTGVSSTVDSGIVSTLLMLLGPVAIGIVISKKLKGWKRTVQNERSVTQSISDELPGWGWREVRDFENRFRIMRDEDPDKILVEAGATLKNFSKRGNELYETKRIIRNRTLKILKYVDPSTGRIYISFVPDHINDADEAMAWKFSITKQEYHNMVDEG